MSLKSYTKSLQIKVDAREVDELKLKLDRIYVDTIKSAMSDVQGKSEEDITKLKSLKAMLDELAQTNQSQGSGQLNKLIKDKLSRMATDLADSIKDFFSDVFANAKERMMDMSSYDLGNSLITNQGARSQALQYGITDPSQNYALSQAMSELGMSSQEDLMYMNEKQQEKFAERMGYWTSKYDELANADFFNTMQQFSLEWGEFKSEMELGVIEFFMQNKETIKQVMTTGISFMEGTLLMLGKILEFFQIERTDSQKMAASMEIVRNYASSNTNTNVNINNTLNPSSQVLTDKQMLSEAGTLVYTQIIEALKG